jgi:hypothetical protein
MKVCLALFGNSEFSLRLPNILAHGIYILSTIGMVKMLNNKWLILPGFVLLNFNPYLLDYFSLARGYGLASGFMAASLLFMFKYLKNQKIRDISFCFFFATLSIFANLSWLNFYLALAGVFFFYLLIGLLNKTINTRSSLFFIRLVPVFSCSVFIFLALHRPVQKLVAYKELFFGGHDGFWKDTIYSLMRDTLYIQSAEKFALPLMIVMLSFFGLSLAALVILLIARKFSNLNHPAFVCIILLFIAGFSTIVQHYLLGTLFLTDRTALLFVPLFALYFISFLDLISEKKYPGLVSFALASGSSLFMGGVFLNALNLHSVRDFKYDSNTKAMLEALAKDIPDPAKKERSIYLGAIWVHIPSIMYYQQTHNLYWMKPLYRFINENPSQFDYYYVKGIDDYDRKQFLKEQKRIVIEYPDTQTALVKWKPDN